MPKCWPCCSVCQCYSPSRVKEFYFDTDVIALGVTLIPAGSYIYMVPYPNFENECRYQASYVYSLDYFPSIHYYNGVETGTTTKALTIQSSGFGSLIFNESTGLDCSIVNYQSQTGSWSSYPSTVDIANDDANFVILTRGQTKWLCPEGVTSITVTCLGPGGAGGAGGASGGSGTGGGGGGGGGGEIARSTLDVEEFTEYTLKIGVTFINAFTAPNSGDTTWFSLDGGTTHTVLANGGQNASSGTQTTGGAGGAGGTGGTGDVTYNGGAGGAGSYVVNGSGGGGGGSSAGDSAVGANGTNASGSTPGTGGATVAKFNSKFPLIGYFESTTKNGVGGDGGYRVPGGAANFAKLGYLFGAGAGGQLGGYTGQVYDFAQDGAILIEW